MDVTPKDIQPSSSPRQSWAVAGPRIRSLRHGVTLGMYTAREGPRASPANPAQDKRSGAEDRTKCSEDARRMHFGPLLHQSKQRTYYIQIYTHGLQIGGNPNSRKPSSIYSIKTRSSRQRRKQPQGSALAPPRQPQRVPGEWDLWRGLSACTDISVQQLSTKV